MRSLPLRHRAEIGTRQCPNPGIIVHRNEHPCRFLGLRPCSNARRRIEEPRPENVRSGPCHAEVCRNAVTIDGDEPGVAVDRRLRVESVDIRNLGSRIGQCCGYLILEGGQRGPDSDHDDPDQYCVLECGHGLVGPGEPAEQSPTRCCGLFFPFIASRCPSSWNVIESSACRAGPSSALAASPARAEVRSCRLSDSHTSPLTRAASWTRAGSQSRRTRHRGSPGSRC